MRRPPNRTLLLLATAVLVAAAGTALSRGSGAAEPAAPHVVLGKLLGGL